MYVSPACGSQWKPERVFKTPEADTDSCKPSNIDAGKEQNSGPLGER